MIKDKPKLTPAQKFQKEMQAISNKYGSTCVISSGDKVLATYKPEDKKGEKK